MTTRVRRSEEGFTLVELLIVIIVLGLLAAIVIFGIGSTRGDAVRSVCATRVRSIVGSAEAVKVSTSAYPTGTIDDTTASNPLVASQTGALLKDWPTSPDFVLRYVGTGGTSYTVDVFKGDGTTSVAGCDAL
jgi:prepilin-type N-terminal cleavage/methylation domain-containing protein